MATDMRQNLGGDPKTDLAVIQALAEERLPHATFGGPDKVEVGERAVPIGTPCALDKTVTKISCHSWWPKGAVNSH